MALTGWRGSYRGLVTAVDGRMRGVTTITRNTTTAAKTITSLLLHSIRVNLCLGLVIVLEGGGEGGEEQEGGGGGEGPGGGGGEDEERG